MYNMQQMAAILATISADPFDYLNGTQKNSNVDSRGITTDPVLINIGSSWVHLMEVTGALGVVISLIICGFKMILYKGDPRQSAEVKKEILHRCLIAVVIFGFIGIIGLMFDVCGSFLPSGG